MLLLYSDKYLEYQYLVIVNFCIIGKQIDSDVFQKNVKEIYRETNSKVGIISRSRWYVSHARTITHL